MDRMGFRYKQSADLDESLSGNPRENTGILPLNLQRTIGKFANSDHGFIVKWYRKVVTFVDLNN